MPKNFDLKRRAKGVVDLRHGLKSKPVMSGKAPLNRQSASSAFLKSDHQDYAKLKRLPKKNGRAVLIVLIIILFLLVGAAAAGFIFFGPQGSSTDSVKVSLATAKSIASGEELGLALSYENIDQIALQDIEVIFEYPEGFFFDRANLRPTGAEQNIWRLPDLQPDQSGKIEIDGQLIGELNGQKEFKVTFYYQPQNFSSTFKTELVTSVKITDVLFEVQVEAPAEITRGSGAAFKANFKNTTALTMENMDLSFNLGESFVLTEAQPSTTADLIWHYEKILPNTQGQLALLGTYQEGTAGEVPWEFRVWQNIIKDEKPQARLIYQAAGTVKIVAPDLKVSFEFLNPDSVAWGEDLKCQLVVANDGQAEVQNLQAKVRFNSAVIDWPRFANQTSAQVSDGALAWFKDNGDFGQKIQQLKDGASEKLTFNLPIIPKPDNLEIISPEELLVSAKASLAFDFNGQQQLVDSPEQIAFLAIQPQLLSEARYNLDAGTVVGQGPLPPVIGQETQYRIYLKLFSGSRGLAKVEVKTSLPAYINWVGVKDETTLGTPLKYDEATRQVIWQIESLSANTQVMASFNVAVTPNDTQVNQLLILTNPVSLSATEQGTNNLVAKTTNLLTSDLLGDPVEQGQGRVKVE